MPYLYMIPEAAEITVRKLTADVVDASSYRVAGEEVLDAEGNLKNVNVVVYSGV